ncbi:unnamed protein product [Scytosiphon promiscuus]
MGSAGNLRLRFPVSAFPIFSFEEVLEGTDGHVRSIFSFQSNVSRFGFDPCSRAQHSIQLCSRFSQHAIQPCFESVFKAGTKSVCVVSSSWVLAGTWTPRACPERA